MKRSYPPKRRDRKTGQSPYARYSKAPFEYSSEYRTWRAQFRRNVNKNATASAR